MCARRWIAVLAGHVLIVSAFCLAMTDAAHPRSIHWHPVDHLSDEELTEDAVTGLPELDEHGEVTGNFYGYLVAVADDSVTAAWLVDTDPDPARTAGDIRRRSRSLVDPIGQWGPTDHVTNGLSVTNVGIAASPTDGSIHVLYASNEYEGQGPFGTSSEIVHRWFDGTWHGPTAVSSLDDEIGTTGVGKRSNRPVAHADESGNIWAAWMTRQKSSGDPALIRASVFTSSGTWTEPIDVSISTHEPYYSEDDGCIGLPDCYFISSRAVNSPAFVVANGEFISSYKDDQYNARFPLQIDGPDTLFADQDCADQSGGGSGGVRDIISYKKGTYTLGPSSVSMAWWGDSSFSEGSDVRVTPRQLEETLGTTPTCVGDVQEAPPSFLELPLWSGHPTVAQWLWSAERTTSIAHDAIGNIYTFWWTGTAYRFGDDGGGSEIACRVFEKDLGGSWGRTKNDTPHIVTRSPIFGAFPDSIYGKDSTAKFMKAASGGEWIHLAHSRTEMDSAGGGWNNPSKGIYYVTHHQDALHSDWGWETRISDSTQVGGFPHIAVSDVGLHAVWTERDAGGRFGVYYREGEFVGTVLPSGSSETWDGIVFLDDDFTVEENATLTIEQGTIVYCQTPYSDRTEDNNPPTGDLVDIVVRGQLIVEGAANDPVLFTATRGSTEGEWGGITFELQGIEQAGYGYVTCVEPLSEVSNAHIENAAYGIRIRDLCAPSLSGVTFSDITDDQHVMLDETDVIIPLVFEGAQIVDFGSWALAGSTHVVATVPGLSSHQDSDRGETGKGDLIVFGRLATTGSAEDGDSVYFHSDQQLRTNDWGGIMFESYTSGNVLDYADISHAITPVYMFYPDSAVTLSNSRIHLFDDVGVWVDGTWPLGAVVRDCVIDRGTPQTLASGSTGIFLDGADEVEVTGNWVLLEGLERFQGGSGIHVLNSSTHCNVQPLDSDLVLIEDNFVMGPGEEVGTGVNYVGIRLENLCLEDGRSLEVRGNYIERWERNGIRVQSVADVPVNCNYVDQCRTAVEVIQSNDDVVRFRENKLAVFKPDNDYRAAKTNTLTQAAFGPDVADSTGENRFVAAKPTESDTTRFVEETAAESGDTLNATDCYWYDYDPVGPTEVLITTLDPIRDRLVETPAGEIDVAGFRQIDIPPTCLPSRPQGAPEAAWRQRAATEPASEGGRQVAVDDLPAVVSFDGPQPNPAAAEVRFALGVPAQGTGVFVLEVFDVAGRKVYRKEQALGPGRHIVVWSGRDRGGKEVGSGVFFARMSGPGIQEMKRVLLVRR